MAADGALIGNRCYADQSQAADAYYSAVAPSQTPGATSYLSVFEKVSGAWKLRRYQVDTGGSVALLTESPVPALAFPSCDPYEPFKDGMAVGWGVVACMVLAWGVAVLRRGI
jgi:hypothetical protein